MGMSSDGILVYGYNLGGAEGEYELKNLGGEYDAPDVPWWSEEVSQDPADKMEEILLAAAGFTEADYQLPGYWERKRKAESELGVGFHFSGSHDYSNILLTAWHEEVTWGEVKIIDFPELDMRRLDEDWDGKLARALEILGLIPKSDHAEWLLASFYG